jgi:hypothetical protein
LGDVITRGFKSVIARKNVAASGIAYVGQAITYNGYSTGPTVSYPTVSSNDIMLAFAAANDAANTGTPPAGWTKILEIDSASSTTVSIFWKRAGGSEPASEVWTSIFDANEASGWVVVAYSGCAAAGSPIGSFASEGSGYTTAKDISDTSTANNSMSVAIMSTSNGGANPFTWDSGTERYDNVLGSALTIAINDEIIAATGAYSVGGDLTNPSNATEAVITLIP